MTITISEAIAALKQAKNDPEIIDREIRILEGEIAKLQDQIAGKRELIKTLRKLSETKSSVRVKTARAGLEESPAQPTETQQKLMSYLRKHGPAVATEIAKDLGMPIGPCVATLSRGRHLFSKRPDARWELVSSAN